MTVRDTTQIFTPKLEDVKLFQTIPTKLHYRYMHNYPNSFTGKEAVAFMKKVFNVSNENAIQFGNKLLQAEVILPATHRFNTTFSDKNKFIYTLNVTGSNFKNSIYIHFEY